MTAKRLLPAHDNAFHALGMFVAAWSVLDGTIEACIAKLLGLAALEGSIVTAPLQFKAKTSLLRCLLERDPKKHAAAITLIKQVQSRTERNNIIHGVIGIRGDSIKFVRRTADGVFKSKEHVFSAIDLFKLGLEFSGMTMQLQTAVGVSEAEYSAFIDAAHSAANKP